ncbi:MAG TPA: DUF4440 domain-containing protein [Steroidobacteraceae bacterium]|nr:DUF4440 domain-containing protein [Steroidobacteraceae bacterium]
MSRFAILGLLAASVLGMADCSRSPGVPITQAELMRRTQAIIDAIAIGDRRPFEKYYAADSIIVDETGHIMDKKAFVEAQSPLPTGYSGSIRLLKPQSRILGDTAVLSYDMDETETIYGQELKARYHETDTWVRRDGEYQIVAEQVLRYYEDPAPGRLDAKHYSDYVGTYQLAPGVLLTVSAEGGQLIRQRAGRAKELLTAEAPDLYFRKGVEGRLLFQRDEQGRVIALIDRRNNEDVVWKRFAVKSP